MSAPKVFCFINLRAGRDMLTVVALSEDGHLLASHLSSNERWARHDIGATSPRKHDLYDAHYPDGYELEWVAEPMGHEGLNAAYARHLALAQADPQPEPAP